MVDILGILEDGETLPAFNCETGVDPQHLRSLFPGLLKLPQLGVGSREPKMGQLYVGSARCEFAQQTHRVPIVLEHVMGLAHPTCRVHERLKRIKVHVSLQYLDRSCGFACKQQGSSVSIVDEIGIECNGSLEFGHAGVVLALEKQDISKLSVSFRQAGVEMHSRLRQFKGAIECRGNEVIAIKRV